uniref:Uncharacterized protein n=1 Tax=Arundo donax TaxID=35708 RepID=A0A0A8Z7I2_ARUDO
MARCISSSFRELSGVMSTQLPTNTFPGDYLKIFSDFQKILEFAFLKRSDSVSSVCSSKEADPWGDSPSWSIFASNCYFHLFCSFFFGSVFVLQRLICQSRVVHHPQMGTHLAEEEAEAHGPVPLSFPVALCRLEKCR